MSKEIKLSKEQMKMELLAGIQEQFYPGSLNYAGLALIGLLELKGDFIEQIITEENKK